MFLLQNEESQSSDRSSLSHSWSFIWLKNEELPHLTLLGSNYSGIRIFSNFRCSLFLMLDLYFSVLKVLLSRTCDKRRALVDVLSSAFGNNLSYSKVEYTDKYIYEKTLSDESCRSSGSERTVFIIDMLRLKTIEQLTIRWK